jgi:hypothetical protein
VVALAVAGVSTGLVAAKPVAAVPLTLVLQKSDFPSGTAWVSGAMRADGLLGLRELGAAPRGGAFFNTAMPVAQGSEGVYGELREFPSKAHARKGFAFLRAGMKPLTPFAAPRFGDAQVTNMKRGPAPIAEVLVLRNRTVWSIMVRADQFYAISMARARSELVKYAGLQQQHVGGG